MIVYRLEAPNGWGVFCDIENDLNVRFNNYYEDSIWGEGGCSVQGAGHNSPYRFACGSINDLIAYFGSDFARIIGGNGIIAAYKVRKNYVLFGENGVELAFLYEKAERVSI